MASNWIKVGKDTPEKPEIAILADKIGKTIPEAFLEFFRVYSWADSITSDGTVPHLSLLGAGHLSRCCPETFPALASPEIGWILPFEGDWQKGFVFANWDRHNGRCCKARALDTEKKKKQRSKPKELSRSQRDIIGPREEKIVSSKEDTTPAITFDEFREVWNATPGNSKCIATSKERIASFKLRMKEDMFRDNWRVALGKFPLQCFASQPGSLKPDIEFFLRPKTVLSIIEGKYDWSKTNGHSDLDDPIKYRSTVVKYD